MLIVMSNIHMISLMRRLWLTKKCLFGPWLVEIMAEFSKLIRHIQNAAVDVPPTANPFQLIKAYQAFTIAFQQV